MSVIDVSTPVVDLTCEVEVVDLTAPTWGELMYPTDNELEESDDGVIINLPEYSPGVLCVPRGLGPVERWRCTRIAAESAKRAIYNYYH